MTWASAGSSPRPVSIVKGYLIELLMRVKPGMCSADLAWPRLAASTPAELAAFSWANVKSKQPSSKKIIQKF